MAAPTETRGEAACCGLLLYALALVCAFLSLLPEPPLLRAP